MHADHLINCMVMRALLCVPLLCCATCIIRDIITAKSLDRQQQLVGLLEPRLAALLEHCNPQQRVPFARLFMLLDGLQI